VLASRTAEVRPTSLREWGLNCMKFPRVERK
jgi:hypothetical protein